MAALRSRCGHYIFALWFLSFYILYLSSFPRLISAAADWILPYFDTWCGPWYEFRMQVWNVLHAARARWKCMTQKNAKNRHLGTIAQPCRAISSQLRHVSTIGKKLVKQQYLPHMSPQYGELLLTSGWDRFVSLRHPCKFQRVSRLGRVTARHCSSGRQPNFAALSRGRYLYSEGRPSRWELAHISSYYYITVVIIITLSVRWEREGMVGRVAQW